MHEFKVFDASKELFDDGLTFTFSDDTAMSFTLGDFYNFLRFKAKKLPTFEGDKLVMLDAYPSMSAYWTQFNTDTAENYTRIKDALEEEYNVLDNYNGIIESTMTDTFDKDNTLAFTGRYDTRTLNNSDTLTFNNRLDTQTLNNSDTLSFTNRLDTETHNTNEAVSSDALSPKTTTTTTSSHTVNTHYTTGFNSETAVIEYEDVTAIDPNEGNSVTVSEAGTMNTAKTGTVTNGKAGSEVNAHSGTITDAKSGSEVSAHSGTIQDAKTGTETNSETGTITHVYEEEKHGNLGVRSSQEMLLQELSLRLKYNLRDLIIKDYIDRYFYL